MVFFCEEASEFSAAYGCDDAYSLVLMRIFDHALRVVRGLPDDQWHGFRTRLERVCAVCDGLGYGIKEERDGLLLQHEE